MEELASAATAQGDLADVVACAGATASTHHHPPPAPAAAHMSPRYTAGQIMTPYQEEQRRSMSMAGGGDVVMFEAPSVDPYVPPEIATRAASYGLPQHHQLALQISQHACCGDDVMMGATRGAHDDGDDAMRISPLTPAAHHQMIKRKNDVRKVVCIPAPPATSGRTGGDVIPSDLWAWRKYGQKPIKGSPYPRGYYRCSSSKGCMARKQVERSRSDPNMLVITYTAEHNHAWPMQRNVLAGYARAHTHSSTKKQHNKTDGTISSSSNNYHCSYSAPEQNEIGGGQPANRMAAALDCVGAGEGRVVHVPCNGHQPDEVFSELEELEPDNSMISANIYSRGVSYEWHKL